MYDATLRSSTPGDVFISTRTLGMASIILDAGCGTGENALFFVERGCKVMGRN